MEVKKCIFCRKPFTKMHSSQAPGIPAEVIECPRCGVYKVSLPYSIAFESDDAMPIEDAHLIAGWPSLALRLAGRRSCKRCHRRRTTSLGCCAPPFIEV